MITFDRLSFQYRSGTQASSAPSLKETDLHIKKGETVVIAGESGCGKTTVGRLINGLAPNFYEGNSGGDISVCGMDPRSQPLFETAKKVGSVFQNPRTQFFNVDTTSEVAFACENQGLAKEEIMRRMDLVIHSFRIESLMNRSIFELSGGEKQKIACAGVAASDTEVIVMDEPSSNLDIRAIEDLQKVLAAWKREGKTLIIAEHRLYYLRDLADRILVMKNGEVIKELSKDAICSLTGPELEHMGLRSLSMEAVFSEPLPNRPAPADANTRPAAGAKAACLVRQMRFDYSKKQRGIDIRDLEIAMGRISIIAGHNGAGKSTFAKCLCGLQKKCRDNVTIAGSPASKKERVRQSFLVMQDVNTQLFSDSVRGEILLSLRERYGKTAQEEKLREESDRILALLDLPEIADRHPLSLSGGQKQRVAIAGAIAADKSLIIFDEPTSGLDLKHMQEVAGVLRQLANMGKAVIVITHDIELILACADDIVCLDHGSVKETYRLNDETKSRLKYYFFD